MDKQAELDYYLVYNASDLVDVVVNRNGLVVEEMIYSSPRSYEENNETYQTVTGNYGEVEKRVYRGDLPEGLKKFFHTDDEVSCYGIIPFPKHMTESDNG